MNFDATWNSRLGHLEAVSMLLFHCSVFDALPTSYRANNFSINLGNLVKTAIILFHVADLRIILDLIPEKGWASKKSKTAIILNSSLPPHFHAKLSFMNRVAFIISCDDFITGITVG
jgi:hypothetical protein